MPLCAGAALRVRIMLGVRLPLHGKAQKGRKDRKAGDNIGFKDGQIEVAASTGGGATRDADRGTHMRKADNTGLPGRKDDKSGKSPPEPVEDDRPLSTLTAEIIALDPTDAVEIEQVPAPAASRQAERR